MGKLIGTAPNQVPSNGDLGGMAYQHPEAIFISGGVIGGKDVGAPTLASEILFNPSGTGLTAEQVQAALVEIAAQLVPAIPAGMVFTFAGATAPSGFLLCNGAAVSRTTYAGLFAAINTIYGVGNGTTTFNLPDLRAEFIRGLDSGRGIDVDRILGSNQAHMFETHIHKLIGYAPAGSFAQNGASNALSNVGDTDLSPPTTGTFGSETRPRNVAMNFCIKI